MTIIDVIKVIAVMLELFGLLKISHAMISHLSPWHLIKELFLSCFSSRRAELNINFSEINREQKGKAFAGLGIVVLANFISMVVQVST